MDNNTYLRTLKSQLRSMDAKTRKEILNEVKSSIDDDPNANLEARFGPVYKLAANYLEDMPTKATWLQRIGIGFKWVLIGLGIVFALIIALIFGLLKLFDSASDDFDYSNANAPELAELNWNTLEETPSKIDVMQSMVIVYTGDYKSFQYSCEHELFDFDLAANSIEIKQDKCYLRLPADVASIDAKQSSIVLTNLSRDLDINLWQAHLRLAGTTLPSIESTMVQCEDEDVAKLNGDGSKLSLSGKWCAVEGYVYDAE